jgi:aminoglycoside phosphotransferase
MQQNTDKQTIIKEKAFVRSILDASESTEVVFSDLGLTSRVYLINSGEIVFKFPRNNKIKEEYEREVLAYKIAHDIKADILIPEVQWEHPEKNYLGYKGVVGAPMDSAVSTLTAAEKKKFGSQLGRFLRKFHKHDMENALLMSPEKEFAEYQHKLALGLPDIKKYFTEIEVARIQEYVLKEYPEKMRKLGFTKGLCHGDLGYWNIIYGSDGEVGIIDFGDVGYYDTSIDFAGMSDREILDAALESYEGNIPREKVELRMKIIPVLDLPFFIGRNDQEGIKTTIARIREITLQ